MGTTTKTIQPTSATITLPDYYEKADINVINTNFTNVTEAVNALNSNIAKHTSNANGEAWQFDSGLMIAVKAVKSTPTDMTQGGSIYFANLALGSWPINFASTPYVFALNNKTSDGYGAWIEMIKDTSTSSAGTASLAKQNNNFATTNIVVCGIGSWK